MSAAPPRASRLLERWLGGAGFGGAVIAALISEALLSTAVLLLPLSRTPLATFAEEFKRACFGFDAGQERYVWPMVASFTVAPLLLATFVLAVYWVPLKAAKVQGLSRLWPSAALGAGVVLASSTGLLLVEDQGLRELPFPADGLRTALTAPRFELTDQHGARFGSDALSGRVALITALYASCGTTCPMIMAEVKQALSQLTERERAGLTVAAITLDPARDTPQRLAELARARALPSNVHLLTGAAGTVEGLLDRFAIARRRNPATGLIEHQNVFILLDIHGRIAYRLSAGSQQREWLGAALRRLLGESPEQALAQTLTSP